MDEAGETVVIWQRQGESGIGSDVQASTRSPGRSFSEPIELSPAATEPDVAMTPAGEAVAVWRHFDVESGEYVIQASFRQPGGGFSAPDEVSTSPAAALPQDLHVVFNAAGEAALVWVQKDPSSTDPNQFSVLASLRPAGGGFSTPAIVSPQPLTLGNDAENPRVAIDAAGDVTVLWSYFDGTNSVIQAASRPVAGSFSAPSSLTADGEDAFSPSVAMDSAGDAIAVWDRSNGTNDVIQSSTASPGGSFSSPVELSDASQSAFEPELAMDPAGDAVAVWTRSNGTNDVIQSSTASPGGSFSSPVELSEAGQNASNPELAINPGAVVAVVWQRSNGTNEIVQASTGSAAGSFSAPVELSAAGQDALFPGVAMDGAGDATAVWKRSNGTNEIVEAAGYDVAAPVLRDLSVPSSGTVGTPVTFSVDPFDVWPIASTTFGFGDGAKAEGTSVSHTYSASGTYQVTVTSTDGPERRRSPNARSRSCRPANSRSAGCRGTPRRGPRPSS